MMMDAPEPSEVAIVRGPETRFRGVAAKPFRPPDTTSARIQRYAVGVGVCDALIVDEDVVECVEASEAVCVAV